MSKIYSMNKYNYYDYLFSHFNLISARVTDMVRRREQKSSPYSITKRMVPELIQILGSQPAGDVSHKTGGRLPLLSARPAVTPQPLRRLLPILLLGEQRHDGCKQFA